PEGLSGWELDELDAALALQKHAITSEREVLRNHRAHGWRRLATHQRLARRRIRDDDLFGDHARVSAIGGEGYVVREMRHRLEGRDRGAGDRVENAGS